VIAGKDGTRGSRIVMIIGDVRVALAIAFPTAAVVSSSARYS
jgi:hypothetical protein